MGIGLSPCLVGRGERGGDGDGCNGIWGSASGWNLNTHTHTHSRTLSHSHSHTHTHTIHMTKPLSVPALVFKLIFKAFTFSRNPSWQTDREQRAWADFFNYIFFLHFQADSRPPSVVFSDAYFFLFFLFFFVLHMYTQTFKDGRRAAAMLPWQPGVCKSQRDANSHPGSHMGSCMSVCVCVCVCVCVGWGEKKKKGLKETKTSGRSKQAHMLYTVWACMCAKLILLLYCTSSSMLFTRRDAINRKLGRSEMGKKKNKNWATQR